MAQKPSRKRDRTRIVAATSALRRYHLGMRRFLTTTVDAAEAERRVADRIERRAESFLETLALGVYAYPGSPYGRLLDWAGVELGDVRALVSDRGVEGALEALREAGVSATFEEVKGRVPIVRPGLELQVKASDFDNPLASSHWRGGTGGSTGMSTRINSSFDVVETDVAYFRLCLQAFGADEQWPMAIWLMAPPGTASINQVFRTLKIGGAPERWWTPTSLSWRGSSAKYALFTTTTVVLLRAMGRRVPRPRHLSPGDAEVAARWLAAKVGQGRPGVLGCTASAAARVCAAAAESRLDVNGSLFLVGGEPFTEAIARVVDAVGARAASSYYMSEFGQIGIACAEPLGFDDVHLATDAIAVIQHVRAVPGGDVPALLYTTLSPQTPKLMLNLESGDYGELGQRICGCPATSAGLTLHLRNIRSYEKLTIEGTHFFGSELLALVENILPRHFGGEPHDYQFVEDRSGHTGRLVVAVSPRLGSVDEEALVAAVVGHLERHGDGQRKMSETLARSGAIEVRRIEPEVTAAGKTPVLRMI
jgi:hypothetical protein